MHELIAVSIKARTIYLWLENGDYVVYSLLPDHKKQKLDTFFETEFNPFILSEPKVRNLGYGPYTLISDLESDFVFARDESCYLLKDFNLKPLVFRNAKRVAFKSESQYAAIIESVNVYENDIIKVIEDTNEALDIIYREGVLFILFADRVRFGERIYSFQKPIRFLSLDNHTLYYSIDSNLYQLDLENERELKAKLKAVYASSRFILTQRNVLRTSEVEFEISSDQNALLSSIEASQKSIEALKKREAVLEDHLFSLKSAIEYLDYYRSSKNLSINTQFQITELGDRMFHHIVVSSNFELHNWSVEATLTTCLASFPKYSKFPAKIEVDPRIFLEKTIIYLNVSLVLLVSRDDSVKPLFTKIPIANQRLTIFKFLKPIEDCNPMYSEELICFQVAEIFPPSAWINFFCATICGPEPEGDTFSFKLDNQMQVKLRFESYENSNEHFYRVFGYATHPELLFQLRVGIVIRMLTKIPKKTFAEDFNVLQSMLYYPNRSNHIFKCFEWVEKEEEETDELQDEDYIDMGHIDYSIKHQWYENRAYVGEEFEAEFGDDFF